MAKYFAENEIIFSSITPSNWQLHSRVDDIITPKIIFIDTDLYTTFFKYNLSN